jgi:cobalt transporter subunit CbtB
MKATRMPSGVTAKEIEMNAMTNTAVKSASGLLPIVFVALIGATLLFVAGMAQSATLHDAAHDVRHATGFPCH